MTSDKGGQSTSASPERVNSDRSRGDDGQGDLVEVQSLRENARKVVKQIETPRSPDPIMRRPCADREEKRATREERDGKTAKEQLDRNDPNQRRLLVLPNGHGYYSSDTLNPRYLTGDRIGKAIQVVAFDMGHYLRASPLLGKAFAVHQA